MESEGVCETKPRVRVRARAKDGQNRQPVDPITDPDEPLRLDSLAMMRLVSFMETDVDYTVQDDELTLHNFESLRTVVQMIRGEGTKMG